MVNIKVIIYNIIRYPYKQKPAKSSLLSFSKIERAICKDIRRIKLGDPNKEVKSATTFQFLTQLFSSNI